MAGWSARCSSVSDGTSTSPQKSQSCPIRRLNPDSLTGLTLYPILCLPRLLHRAEGFYSAHLASDLRLSGADDGLPDPTNGWVGNLFLMRPRSGVEEQSWKHGLVKAPGEGGSRIPSSPEQSIFSDSPAPDLGPGHRMRGVTDPTGLAVGAGLGGGKPYKGGEPTVWRRGRLERRGSEGSERTSDRDSSLTPKIERRSVESLVRQCRACTIILVG